MSRTATNDIFEEEEEEEEEEKEGPGSWASTLPSPSHLPGQEGSRRNLLLYHDRTAHGALKEECANCSMAVCAAPCHCRGEGGGGRR
jgi:hypothetical protein